jgi:hypothetical protein
MGSGWADRDGQGQGRAKRGEGGGRGRARWPGRGWPRSVMGDAGLEAGRVGGAFLLDLFVFFCSSNVQVDTYLSHPTWRPTVSAHQLKVHEQHMLQSTSLYNSFAVDIVGLLLKDLNCFANGHCQDIRI